MVMTEQGNNNNNNGKGNSTTHQGICMSDLAFAIWVPNAIDCKYGAADCLNKYIDKRSLTNQTTKSAAVRTEAEKRYPGNIPHTFRDNILKRL